MVLQDWISRGQNRMKTILIADDNTQIIEVLRQYAVKEGYQVFTAYDGTETLEEFYKRTYDADFKDCKFLCI